MKSFVPDTTASRTLLAMLLALAISHAFAIYFYASDQRNALNLIGGEQVAQRMVTLTHLIDNMPPRDWAKLVSFADETALHVSLTKAPEVAENQAVSPTEELVRAALQRQLARRGDRDFRLRLTDAAPKTLSAATLADAAVQPTAPKMLHVSLQLAPQDWLNFSAVILHPQSLWSIRFILSMLVMTVTVIVASVIAIHCINVPLRRFASAAERLGTNIDAPPLPVGGPREIRQVTSAFNDMQRRIHRMIEDQRQILAAVSHDLRTPITSIRLRAEHIKDAAERSKLLTTLDEMETMVTSILEFARMGATKEVVRTVDMAALVRSVCDNMSDQGRPVTFCGPERLVCECRPTAFRRALTNLIDNAVKYGERARVALAAGRDGVTVTIDDDGPGIPNAELERVFDPFYRAGLSRSRHPSGAGLGLTVARQVVDLHGGEISLANRGDSQLRVTIHLPELLTE